MFSIELEGSETQSTGGRENASRPEKVNREVPSINLSTCLVISLFANHIRRGRPTKATQSPRVKERTWSPPIKFRGGKIKSKKPNLITYQQRNDSTCKSLNCRLRWIFSQTFPSTLYLGGFLLLSMSIQVQRLYKVPQCPMQIHSPEECFSFVRHCKISLCWTISYYVQTTE